MMEVVVVCLSVFYDVVDVACHLQHKHVLQKVYIDDS